MRSALHRVAQGWAYSDEGATARDESKGTSRCVTLAILALLKIGIPILPCGNHSESSGHDFGNCHDKGVPKVKVGTVGTVGAQGPILLEFSHSYCLNSPGP